MMNYMKWFALLGREKSVVRAELASVTAPDAVQFVDSIAIGTATPPKWDTLGGAVRAGTIVAEAASKAELITSFIASLPAPPAAGKVSLGLSSPSLSPRDIKNFGKSLKEEYASRKGKRPRIVFPQNGTFLNAGHLQGSRLLTPPNHEVFVMHHGAVWLAGVTNWQQNIQHYTKRDRERPARDARVGMLPPKLAQSMLNLANVASDSHVHDPFCGTGVILTEALLKGVNISGSDAAPDMVRATKENVDWMQGQISEQKKPTEIFQADAQTVRLPQQTTHIVSEGYLGNPDLRDVTEKRLQEEANNLLPLYRNFFANMSQFPRPLTIVFALPVWFSSSTQQPIYLPILDDLPDMGYTVEQFAPDSASMLIYRRSHQTVGRAIIKLRKG